MPRPPSRAPDDQSPSVRKIGNAGNDQLMGNATSETWIISGTAGTNAINGKGGTGFIQKRGDHKDTIVNATQYTIAVK